MVAVLGPPHRFVAHRLRKGSIVVLIAPPSATLSAWQRAPLVHAHVRGAVKCMSQVCYEVFLEEVGHEVCQWPAQSNKIVKVLAHETRVVLLLSMEGDVLGTSRRTCGQAGICTTRCFGGIPLGAAVGLCEDQAPDWPRFGRKTQCLWL